MIEGDNPYQPPESAIRLLDPKFDVSRWSPLRWLPAAICVIFGAMGFIAFVLMTWRISWVLLHEGLGPWQRRSSDPARVLALDLAATGLFGIGGTWGLFAFRSWMRRRWVWAVILTLAGYFTFTLAVFLIAP